MKTHSPIYHVKLHHHYTVIAKGIDDITDDNATSKYTIVHRYVSPSGISRQFHIAFAINDTINNNIAYKQHISSGISRHDTNKNTIKSYIKSYNGINNIFTFVYQYNIYNNTMTGYMQ